MKYSLSTLVVFACLLSPAKLPGEQPVSTPNPTAATTGNTAAEMASPQSAAAQAAVPRLIMFSGTLRDLAGKPVTGPVEVTFGLYAEETDGAPLWFETQTLQADRLGHYNVLLGAMSPAGVPMELFTSGQAHWLGVQVSNLPEQARALLVSVPYAMKAGDAETLGGKPASAYMLSSQANSQAASAANAATLSGMITSGPTRTTTSSDTAVTQAFTQNYLPKFADNAGGLTNSVLFQSGTKIGINTDAPAFGLDLNSNGFAVGTKTALPGAGGTMRFRDDTGTQRWLFGIPGTAGSQDFFMYNYANGHQPIFIQAGAFSNSLYLSGSGNVGILTNSPSFALDVNSNVIAVGTKAAFAGGGGTLRFRDDTGTERWAMGVPGSAGATDFFFANLGNGHQPFYIQAAAPTNTLYLDASGNLGVGTASPAHTLDVAGEINASGNVTSTGTVTGNGFSGNGSGLTSLTGANVTGTVPSATSATTAGTSNDLNCAGCVSSSEVNFNYAGSGSKGGAATSALTAGTATTAATATDALSLGGVAAANYARRDVTNNFATDQTITGNLNLTGTMNGLCIVPSKTSGTSTSANMLGGFTGLGEGGGCVPAVSTGAVKNTVLPGGNTIADGVVGGTIAGGGGIYNGNPFPNRVWSNFATVGGGADNEAGNSLDINACCEFVGGGIYNKATYYGATVAGGAYNHATYYHATVPGGYSNTAGGWFSFAAGCNATAANDGSFVWSGSKGGGFGNCTALTSSAVGQFVALAPGGFTFYPATSLANPVTIAATTGDISTSGKVTAGGLAVDSSTLVVDSTNNRVGVGVTTPARALEVYGDIYISRSGFGIILKNGTVCARVTLSASGNLAATPMTCP